MRPGNRRFQRFPDACVIEALCLHYIVGLIIKTTCTLSQMCTECVVFPDGVNTTTDEMMHLLEAHFGVNGREGYLQ